ncbi:hypothetical protein C8Q74DRAFT_946760 [Fomes fomentarius]|nr:hypothetical protein C8Q74DRAFT_946760 [Fomes fomentarius]
MMFSSALLILAAVAPAFATVYVTAPVDSTSWTANQEQTVSWQDDNTAPALKDFGLSKVSVYVGNQNQQTLVQSIVDSVDVSTTSSIKFTPEASVGENGKYYFVRFESINLKDPKNPQFPALAFSSKSTALPVRRARPPLAPPAPRVLQLPLRPRPPPPRLHRVPPLRTRRLLVPTRTMARSLPPQAHSWALLVLPSLSFLPCSCNPVACSDS